MSINYATRKVEVSPGGSEEIYREASFITCLGATAPFKLKLDHGPAFEFEAGISIALAETFERITIVNETAADNVIRLGLGKGQITDARLVLSGEVATRESTPDVLATGPQVVAGNAAATLVAASNTSRVEALITNEGAGKVYVAGSAAAGAGEGLPLEASQTMVLNTTAALYVRNDTGANVNIAVAQVERS
jgi:hypothetical protein